MLLALTSVKTNGDLGPAHARSLLHSRRPNGQLPVPCASRGAAGWPRLATLKEGAGVANATSVGVWWMVPECTNSRTLLQAGGSCIRQSSACVRRRCRDPVDPPPTQRPDRGALTNPTVGLQISGSILLGYSLSWGAIAYLRSIGLCRGRSCCCGEGVGPRSDHRVLLLEILHVRDGRRLARTSCRHHVPVLFKGVRELRLLELHCCANAPDSGPVTVRQSPAKQHENSSRHKQ
ncbi:hypothetical protein PHYPSEUDO_013637 [Phytophthora pseudosyringae]|uniref:Uncharacterized protein n=1 Tax=Phytophthora pseudosyringae TaxID=221518 RepID=A0A8T1V544_9STRA|nr:hypothetical protein PHYPSEUDO_013637 [Phytophthora pseudosyringae]